MSRPGIEEITSTGGVARGQFVWNGALYLVVSEQLLKVIDVETGATSVIGPIAGSEFITTAVGFVEAAIVVKGGAIYTLDKSDNLSTDIVGTSIGGGEILSSVAVAHIDGRFVYVPADGSPAFFSDVGNPASVQVLSFFDAEELPDDNTTTFNLRNTLYIGGTDSFELFQDTGATPVPFTRLTGARIDYGYIGGLTAYADTYFFIGREKDQDFGIYAISQGKAETVSNEAIDVILAGYTQTGLQNAQGARFKWRGYDILTFSLASDSFGFYKGNWFKLTVLEGSTEKSWGGQFINQFIGEYYTSSSDKFGKLAKINTENGAKIPIVVDLAFEQADNEYFACQSVSLGISQGFNPEVGTVGLAMSRNNVEYGEFLFRDLAQKGNYTQHLTWNEPGGLGAYDGFMGMRFYTTQDVTFSSNALSAFFRG